MFPLEITYAASCGGVLLQNLHACLDLMTVLLTINIKTL